MHAATALAAVVLTCRDLQKSVAFYRALGVDVKETKHGGPLAGTTHFTTALGGVHFALYPDDGTIVGAQSATQIALMISNLEGALEALKGAGGKLLSPPSPKPWGVTALVEDPEGRKIELIATRVEVTGPMPF